MTGAVWEHWLTVLVIVDGNMWGEFGWFSSAEGPSIVIIWKIIPVVPVVPVI